MFDTLRQLLVNVRSVCFVETLELQLSYILLRNLALNLNLLLAMFVLE